MNKEEIKELKDYHKRCIESIDNYYLSDSFYEIHNKVFNELDLLHNKIDKAIEYLETNGYGYDCCGDMCYFLDENNQKDLLEILKESEVDECE